LGGEGEEKGEGSEKDAEGHGAGFQ
jgi:hypothetical protein